MSSATIIDKHRQAFLEEAREVLVELESSLLELNERPDDGELVGRVFRSMHTIKGSGAMFGFDEVASFTHHLETAFDEVREGRLAVTSKLVDISLESVDLIKKSGASFIQWTTSAVASWVSLAAHVPAPIMALAPIPNSFWREVTCGCR